MSTRVLKSTRVITVSCRHRSTHAIETFRFSGDRITREDATARAGAQLHALGWLAQDIVVRSVIQQREDATSAATRRHLTGG